jgi:signal transduction histidine kinase
LPATVLLTRLEIGDHAFLQATVRDVSKQKQLEMDLNQAQKLEAIGRLAAGIAHEINTPIQYVGDNIEFLQIAYESLVGLVGGYRRMLGAVPGAAAAPGMAAEVEQLAEAAHMEYLIEQVPRAIEQSLEGVGRVSSIVQAMKEFSHPGSTERTSADLNQCIRSTVTVSRNEWKYVANLETDLDENLPLVLCVPGELNQVFLNMIVNAAHAIGEVVRDDAEEKGTILVSTRRDGNWVEIRISDTGTGIPEPIRGRVFDPFFTTKEVGRGTGQGLAIARNVVVDRHGGAIAVDSEMGKGTTFTIRLPIEGMASLPSELQAG